MLEVVSFVILALNNADILSPEYNHVHEIGNSSGMRVVTYVLDGLNLHPSLALVCKDFTTLCQWKRNFGWLYIKEFCNFDI